MFRGIAEAPAPGGEGRTPRLRQFPFPTARAAPGPQPQDRGPSERSVEAPRPFQARQGVEGADQPGADTGYTASVVRYRPTSNGSPVGRLRRTCVASLEHRPRLTGVPSRRQAIAAPVATQGRCWAFSTKPCDSKELSTVKREHYKRLYFGQTGAFGTDSFGQTGVRTYSTDQVVRTDKYVQAGGLFILWTEQDGNRPTRRAIEGMSGGSGTTRAVFTEVFHLKRLLG